MATKNHNIFTADVKDIIQHCLDYIDPDSPRDEWAKVGMILINELGSTEGEIEFRRWSEKGASYNERDFNSTVKSIIKSSPVNGYKIGTLIFLAKQQGLNTQYLPKTNSLANNIDRNRIAKQTDADQIAKSQLESARKAQLAQKLARFRWNKASVIDKDKLHPYLMKKGITQPIGAKIYKGYLQIPAFSADGDLTTLQSIDKNGVKMIIPDSILSGSSLSIGGNTETKKLPILLCEGWATGQTLYAASKIDYPIGLQVAIAFMCNNMHKIAYTIREKYPNRPIIVCADNDAYSKYNAGLSKAAEIKQNLDNVHLVYPEFNATDKSVYLEQTGSSPTDFNDLYLINGIEKVMVKLREALHNCSLNKETILKTESEISSFINDGI